MASGSTIGGNTFPLAAGAADGVLRPAVADALLDFLAYYLNWALNARLAQMTPRDAEAVPTLNRFAYDPAELWPQNPVPALYVWWKGSGKNHHSTLREKIEASYGFMYVAEEIKVPGGVEPLDGLGEIVDHPAAQRHLRSAEILFGNLFTCRLLDHRRAGGEDRASAAHHGEVGHRCD